MELLITNIHWVMLAGGLITSSMVLAVVAPRYLFRTMFAATAEGPLGDLLARNWGVLITLTAGMLFWGAYHPEVRDMVLVVVAISKIAFVTLILRVPAFRKKAVIPIVVDLALSALFLAYVLAA